MILGIDDRRGENAALLRFIAPSASAAIALVSALLMTRLVPHDIGRVAASLLTIGISAVAGCLCFAVARSGLRHLRRYGAKAIVVLTAGAIGMAAAALMLGYGIFSFVTIP